MAARLAPQRSFLGLVSTANTSANQSNDMSNAKAMDAANVDDDGASEQPSQALLNPESDEEKPQHLHIINESIIDGEDKAHAKETSIETAASSSTLTTVTNPTTTTTSTLVIMSTAEMMDDEENVSDDRNAMETVVYDQSNESDGVMDSGADEIEVLNEAHSDQEDVMTAANVLVLQNNLQEQLRQHRQIVQHTMLPHKKYILQTSSTADGVPVIDVLPVMDESHVDDGVESSDNDADETAGVVVGALPVGEHHETSRSHSNQVAASPDSRQQQHQQHQQLTAQAEVDEMEPHYITVTAIDDEDYVQQDNVTTHETYHVQYVDSAEHMYNTNPGSNGAPGSGGGPEHGLGHNAMSYPVYAVGEYATTSGSGSGAGSAGSGSVHHQQQQQQSQSQQSHYYSSGGSADGSNYNDTTSASATLDGRQPQQQQQPQSHQQQQSQHPNEYLLSHDRGAEHMTAIATSSPQAAGASTVITAVGGSGSGVLRTTIGNVVSGVGRCGDTDSPMNCSAEISYIDQMGGSVDANNATAPTTPIHSPGGDGGGGCDGSGGGIVIGGSSSGGGNGGDYKSTAPTRVAPVTVRWLLDNYENAEGVSLPRSTMYSHYEHHCGENKLDAVNRASLGKLIRTVFTGLRTRRLGTRGNSKYHYYGIRVKATSLLSAYEPAIEGAPDPAMKSVAGGVGGHYPANGGAAAGGQQQQLQHQQQHGQHSHQQHHPQQQQQQQNHQHQQQQQQQSLHSNHHQQQHHGARRKVAVSGLGNGGTGAGVVHSMPKSETYEACAQFLSDGNMSQAACFPRIEIAADGLPLTIDSVGNVLSGVSAAAATAAVVVSENCITADDVDTWRCLYRDHCEAFLEAVHTLDFATVETLWREFWRTPATGVERNADGSVIAGIGGSVGNNNGIDCEEEHFLSKTKLYALARCPAVQDFVRRVDYTFYQRLVDLLIPDVLQPLQAAVTVSLRHFSKNLEVWLTGAMVGCPPGIAQVKMSAAAGFAQTLRRYTSLNHLAQAARAVLVNQTQLGQMLTDLNRVDFRNVQEQAAWVCECDAASVQRLELEFKGALQQGHTLEQWAAWLRQVAQSGVPHVRLDAAGREEFATAARQFLLKWSLYSSMVIRDLTLRSAASFGSFHLIRLLFDEYMFYAVEQRVAEVLDTTPIAVMMGQLSSLTETTPAAKRQRGTAAAASKITASPSRQHQQAQGVRDAGVVIPVALLASRHILSHGNNAEPTDLDLIFESHEYGHVKCETDEPDAKRLRR